MWVSKGDSMPQIDVGSTCQHLQYSDSWIFLEKNLYGGLGDGQKEVLGIDHTFMEFSVHPCSLVMPMLFFISLHLCLSK